MGSKPPPQPRTCGNLPSWELETKPCILKLNAEGQVDRFCQGEPGYPEDIIGVTIERLNCERDYQDTLIRQCKKWKK